MSKPSFIRVIIDRAIHRELDYLVPETLADRVGVGSRVRVPFRDKSGLATVVSVLERSEAKGIRSIEAVVGEAPIVSEQMLELARWISAYYCCPIETVMRSLLPQVIRRAELGWKKQLFVRPVRKIDNEEIEKLRKRAPRQAELLEAISRLETPMRAADLLSGFLGTTPAGLDALRAGLSKAKPDSVGRWRKALDERQISDVQREIGPLLAQLGYR